MEYTTTDVLVIGSGAAGLAAAVYAAQKDTDVLVIDKGAFGKSGSTVGAVQIAGIGPWSVPEDSPTAYGKDIYESGRGLSNLSLIEALTTDIEKRLQDVLEWGLKLDQNETNEAAVSLTSGHTIPRSISARKGKSGLGLLQTLTKAAKKKDSITRWSDVITLDLLKQNGKVCGAVVYDLRNKKPYLIQSKAVILAAGGIGQLYSITSNPVQATGDGFSLGLGVGASLIDMEQLQFYPVSLMKPDSLAGLCMSFYHLGKLYNTQGERFMKRYEPETLEDTTRDKLSIAIGKEIAAGRCTSNRSVWLDAKDQLEAVQSYFPHENSMCLKRGVDLAAECAEVGPAAHFVMGGIQINSDASTKVPGLYAAGETSGGLHGGNRLGNNALSECLVFGARAGETAASLSKETMLENQPVLPKHADSLLEKVCSSEKGRLRPLDIKNNIREIMDTYLNVIRTTEGLDKADKKLEKMTVAFEDVTITNPEDSYSREVLDFIEASHMLRTAKVITAAAKTRKESRGAHYNSDFPDQKREARHTCITSSNGLLQHTFCPVKGE
ncbi:FAD-dependent oxidoreductase [Alteribacillus bidgolensis]|uniref:Thiol-driven fumarate reductase, flavoprotein subunit n=1 Tax=Alteribacillus bidgolensis TaxID=930129 RepID=A0A1G8JEP1_9BACI|nr:FAD-dependent oxidoreductase [Alteribacillus bidgolensis]SDI29511.1 thiol-driven fumarate reductase, flavoprotein subunit [Alteribacillus bidgolensis]